MPAAAVITIVRSSLLMYRPPSEISSIKAPGKFGQMEHGARRRTPYSMFRALLFGPTE